MRSLSVPELVEGPEVIVKLFNRVIVESLNRSLFGRWVCQLYKSNVKQGELQNLGANILLFAKIIYGFEIGKNYKFNNC